MENRVQPRLTNEQIVRVFEMIGHDCPPLSVAVRFASILQEFGVARNAEFHNNGMI